ncbi:uncharacterized protein TNCV_1860081 [Trichonephila clavipes]|nr:uncharacterized protein TNCV_1860081 [Trichonephila clavipes]
MVSTTNRIDEGCIVFAGFAVAIRFAPKPSLRPLLATHFFFKARFSALVSSFAEFLHSPRFPQVVFSVGIGLSSSKVMLLTGFRRSSILYEEFQDERESTSEDVKMEPMISFDCAYCDYRSSTQKGLRSHRITVHKIGVEVRCTLDFHGRPLTYFGSCLGAEFSQPTAEALHKSYQPLIAQHVTSVAVWTTSLFASTSAWTPSSVLTALHFSGCFDYKFSHISRCLDTIKCTYSAASQRLFGLQVQSHQSLPGHHQVYLQR